MKPKHHIRLMLILGALAALGPFSIDMYLPGFQAIAAEFNTDIAHISLSLTSYFAGICIGQILCGPLIDRFGRRVPLLIGLIIFLIAAIGCGLSPNLATLVLLRVLLALGACVGMVASRAIIRDLYPPDEMAKVFSTLMLIMGAAPILAPTAGSFFTSTLGWRSIFIFLALFTFMLLTAVYYLLPESRPADKTLSLTPTAVIRDYRIVLRNPDFLVFATAGGLGMAGVFAYISGAPLLFMQILGLSEIQFAWLFGLNALGFISAAQVNRFILQYVSPYRLIMIAISTAALAATGLVIASAFHVHSTPVFAGLIFVFMSSLGPLIPNTTAIALQPFSKFAGSASALIGSLQMLIAALASWAVSGLANGTSLPMAVTMLACASGSFLLIGGKLSAGNEDSTAPVALTTPPR